MPSEVIPKSAHFHYSSIPNIVALDLRFATAKMVEFRDLLHVVGTQVNNLKRVFLADGVEADQALDSIVRENELFQFRKRTKAINTGEKIGWMVEGEEIDEFHI